MRRSVVIALLLLMPLLCPGEDWPRFLGPRGDNTSIETGLLTRFAANGVPIVWEKKIGTGYSAPSVRGGQVVLHHRVGGEEIVESFDAATGKPEWRHAYPSSYTDPYGYNNGPRCTPSCPSPVDGSRPPSWWAPTCWPPPSASSCCAAGCSTRAETADTYTKESDQ